MKGHITVAVNRTKLLESSMVSLASPDDFAGTVRDFLSRDHARIVGLLDQLLGQRSSNRASADDDLWRRFQAAVLDHMEVEEHHLLRHFAEANPGEAAALRAEHTALRQALEQLRPEVGLAAVQRFMAAFSAHARREGPLFYAWAERDADRATQAAVTRELTERARMAAFSSP